MVGRGELLRLHLFIYSFIVIKEIERDIQVSEILINCKEMEIKIGKMFG